MTGSLPALASYPRNRMRGMIWIVHSGLARRSIGPINDRVVLTFIIRFIIILTFIIRFIIFIFIFIIMTFTLISIARGLISISC